MRVVGALLAGGASQRMGRDKAGLMLDGQTLAERALGVLRQVSSAQVILGHRSIQMAEHYAQKNEELGRKVAAELG